ncbi:Hypothetical protein NTJ_10878 [Nesidiocoris tenuis]|uniref:Reverse transcriptase zinc-binding domain-containing protein n=2 Tax=Nesidiocoris tenuis TaxID=355587 RepID=A0ABN7B1E0_9HEMI|nr:Hypothetical protein NTJ_10878 [Nesidiocoris tenuis]
MLETGRSSLYLQTLPLHVKYLLKVMKMPGERLPNVLLREGIRLRLPWAAEWMEMAAGCEVELDFSMDASALARSWEAILVVLRNRERQDFLRRATTSRYHQRYQRLDPLRPPPYDASTDLSRARWMFKARGGAMYLNYVPWRGEAAQRCAMCNTGEKEDVLHFLGACPVLKEFRWQWFGACLMSSEECCAVLRTADFVRVAGFCSVAWRYRWELVQQFNY